MGISHAILLSSSFFTYLVAGASAPGAAADWGAKNAPVCDDVSATVDTGGEDALIFHLTPEQRSTLISSDPDEFASCFSSFVAKVKDAFDKEGLVVIRGLFDDDLLDKLDKDAQAVDAPTPVKEFVTLKFGPVFSDSAFREAALSSTIPHFVAKVLLGLRKNDPMTLRVLKDALLVKGGEKKCCGWHVDDANFWPTSVKSTPGVNAWIAIDDIPSKFGGGLAVSPRSHLAEWRYDAYEAIGSTQIHPEEGLVPGTPSFKRFVGKSGYGKTCDMEEYAPELAAMIDGTKKVFDFKRGDVLFHTRWIFHRSMPMTDDGEKHFQKLGKDPAIKRYSVRYEFGSSSLLRGMSGEFAILNNPQNSGKSLDEVCTSDGPYYPRCWPPVADEDMRNIDQLVTNKFPLAEAKRKDMFVKLRESLAAEE